MTEEQRLAETAEWAASILKALETGDQTAADDPTVRGMSEQEWKQKLPELRKQFGIAA